MKTSVDISLYPLNDDYLPPIRDFIERISIYPEIHVIRNDLGTQLYGEYDHVMDILKIELRHNWETWGQGTFVVKLLMDDLRGIADDQD